MSLAEVMLAHPKRINPTVYGVNRNAVERLAAYSTNLFESLAEELVQSTEEKRRKTIDRAITTAVSLTVSSRLGQTDFRSSDRVSCRNSNRIDPAGSSGRYRPVISSGNPGHDGYLTSAMSFVAPAAGAILPQLQPLWVVAAVLVGRVVPLPAIAALQSDDLSNVSSLSSHNLIQHLGDYAGPYGAAALHGLRTSSVLRSAPGSSTRS